MLFLIDWFGLASNSLVKWWEGSFKMGTPKSAKVRRVSYFFRAESNGFESFQVCHLPLPSRTPRTRRRTEGMCGDVSPWFSLGLLDLQSCELVDPLPYPPAINVAMDNSPCIEHFLTKAFISSGCPIAMFDYQRVHSLKIHEYPINF